ncbi:16S rRNA (guanine(966)-N(2))-methyltransferase RsmD [Rothia kristinae]|uniref:16S rRNA (Guanine(966)-N(2))-methyltransferase RsmD n=1 Tax=Rothia kristinae TaxID=37923 RepID=A0A7T4T4H5_9MICC|nr:16S rRNA (guanine(966)-N(2))-methyltransferase RsmD [Rothia kristinae]MDN5641064.1 16S rRNA (guanine(966)-N(2))-methyltransferase RsmD [Actinomycetes bacterium]QQC59418.1 16S rRNA (guanine(966)-N(2))-methyltransferase RsmD [Rothia kristinae]
MSRIIAGIAGGARLQPVRGRNTRPTTDRVKESLFSRLEGYDVLAGARVLDLFAGSGALGLEAASRGATSADLVDRDRAALSACRTNLAVLTRAGVRAQVSVHDAAARPWLERLPEQPRWDLVFLDPPYAMGREELADLLMRVAPRLDAGGVVVVERSARDEEPVWPAGLERFSHRTYGETALWFAEPAEA